MPTPEVVDLSALVAQEFAKQLPVKQLTEPAAAEAGELGADLMKCLRLALWPVHRLAAEWDRYRRFVQINTEAVTEADRIEPASQIVGPILEGIRYEPEGSMTDEAFGQLLRRAFDRERVGQAHPAFPAIIRSLADDEFVLLKAIAAAPVWVKFGTRDGTEHTPIPVDQYSVAFPQLVHPEQVIAYGTHLEALGLILDLVGQSPEDTDFTKPGPYDMGFELMISEFGKLFAKAVLDNPYGDRDG